MDTLEEAFQPLWQEFLARAPRIADEAELEQLSAEMARRLREMIFGCMQK